ncbi:MAG TPA: methyltransferase [Gammaproteobacteria bacterium]|nr:methyltransferase [Gammaproteobacteria bacterium]
MRPLSLVSLVLLLAAGPQAHAQDAAAATPPYVVPAAAPANVRRAIASPDRTDEQRARDYHRKPAEILTASGIKDGDKVVEIAGFGQYFTTMLVAAVGPSGRVDVYDLPYTERFAGPASREFDAKHANAVYHQESYNDVTLPQNVDSVWNVLYYHDLQPNGVDTAAFNRKIFTALKPGGIFLVIDHKAEDGSGWRDAGTIHRMGVDTIKKEVLAAGFELALESDLLANPGDDRSKMVFAPGTRGTTDQAFFIFRKPK